MSMLSMRIDLFGSRLYHSRANSVVRRPGKYIEFKFFKALYYAKTSHDGATEAKLGTKFSKNPL